MRPKELSTSDVTYKAWMREIADLQQQLRMNYIIFEIPVLQASVARSPYMTRA